MKCFFAHKKHSLSDLYIIVQQAACVNDFFLQKYTKNVLPHIFNKRCDSTFLFKSRRYSQSGKADIRNPLSLLAHERSRFATCQWELLTPTDISIPLTHRLVLYALEAGECLFCVQISSVYNFLIFSAMINLCVNPTDFSLISPSLKYSNVGTELISYSSARDS